VCIEILSMTTFLDVVWGKKEGGRFQSMRVCILAIKFSLEDTDRIRSFSASLVETYFNNMQSSSMRAP